MATRSFKAEFTFNRAEAQALVNALDASKRVDVAPKTHAHFVETDEEVHELFDDILG